MSLSYYDPTKIRLSRNFLLSDLMGCHSVYTLGYRNLFDGDEAKLREGRALAENVLEPLLEKSRLSITYGYISLELARKIVTYQSPEKPSYHQWNDGAACDVVLHTPDIQGVPPAKLAAWIDETLPMSRTISYSESSGLCLGVRASEIAAGKPRHALYENRFVGAGKKPLYVNYSANRDARARQIEEMQDYHDSQPPEAWRGAGYPTYHGGGRRQLQHVRVSPTRLYSDFMYSSVAVAAGVKNALLPTEKHIAAVSHVARVYEELVGNLRIRRLSIIEGYQAPAVRTVPDQDWVRRWGLVLVPPKGIALGDLADAAIDLAEVDAIGVGEGAVSLGGDL